ncbi:tRNA (adenosine(37)-N6)-threonylcarbamoyltransferase complex ATPase subunit type 1 TsaE, partial [Marivivens donghaensis]
MTFTKGPVFLPSEADTDALAQRIAPILRAGDVLLLEGDIGAGKTAFSRA